MKTFPIGLLTRSLRLPIRKALATASEFGAEGVVLDARNELRIADFSQTSFRQFRKLLDDYGLHVAAIEFPTRRDFCDPQDLERRIRATCEAMSFAYKLGASVVLCRMNNLPSITKSDDTPDPRVEGLLQSLELLAAHSDRVGARLAIASSADPVSQAELMAKLPEGLIGIDLDPASLVAAGHDAAEAATLLGPRVLHVRANDAVRELTGAASDQVVETPLGRGSVDLPNLFARLEERGYRGWLTVERNEGPDPSGDLANAIAYLRAL